MSTPHSALLVLTSHDDLGGTGKTGYYVGEAAHPWKVFTEAGWTVDFASIAGGAPPEDGKDDSDPTQVAFLSDPSVSEHLSNTPALQDVDASGYDTVLFVGGHGTMWDFPESAAVARVGREIYEAGGVVAAVCHGPAALLGITLSDGSHLIAGKKLTGFTNSEERAVGLQDVVPYLLEDELTARGASHQAAADFTEHAITDGALVTGQNPQSATAVAEQIVTAVSAQR